MGVWKGEAWPVNRPANPPFSTSPAQHMNPVCRAAPAPLGEYSDLSPDIHPDLQPPHRWASQATV